MKNLYLLGHPVAHSLSPKIHNTASQILGLNYHYEIMDVTKETLPEALSKIKESDCAGFNLTMPLKTAIIPYLSRLSPQASLSGSVNTVLVTSEGLEGYTTDGAGFFESLINGGLDITGKSMVILGAGGAANSIVTEAAFRKLSHIFVYKRKNSTFEEVRNFLSMISEKTNMPIELKDISDKASLKADIATSHLLVNATNVGMAPDTGSTLIDRNMFCPGLTVADIIYNPLETRLLREARESGLDTYNGTHMLLYQAATAYRLWTGCDMPIPEIKKVLF